MLKRWSILIVFINLGLSKNLCGQDIHFTQFYSVPLYLNPAFTGADRCIKMSAAARNQWAGIYKGYSTYMFSAESFLPKYSSGIGITLAKDIAGSAGLKTNLVTINYAYEFLIKRGLALRFGMQGGMQQKSIDYNNLLFGDQIARGGNVTTLEPFIFKKTLLDIGAGTLLYSRKYWIGIAISHLNTPNESLVDKESPLPIKTAVHGGIKLVVKNSPKESERAYIVPAVNYQLQNEFQQISWGFYYLKNPISVGIWYRGIPFYKEKVTGYSNNDALTLLIGISTGKFNFGYSYDITLSRLTMASGGAHEITCYYLLCKKRVYKNSQHITPCPKF